MNFLKIIFITIVLLLALMGGFFVFGLVAALVQFLFFFGVLALVAYIGVKFLRKRPAQPSLDEKQTGEVLPDASLQDADRMLTEYKRKSLSE